MIMKGTGVPIGSGVGGILADHSFIRNQNESPSGGSLSVMLREYEDNEVLVHNEHEEGGDSVDKGQSHEISMALENGNISGLLFQN